MMVGKEEVDHEHVSLLCSTQVGNPSVSLGISPLVFNPLVLDPLVFDPLVFDPLVFNPLVFIF